MNKSVLVTGGAGFIGSHTVVELVTAGYKPIIIDNLSNSDIGVLSGLKKIIGRELGFYEGDYQDKKLLKQIFAAHHIQGVIHFAAHKAVGESVAKPLKYYSNNVAGLIGLMEEMENNNVSQMIFSSSCTVYGEPDKLPITESSPLKPAASPYGATKQMCETILRDAAAGSKSLKILSLRYFNPIGAHQSALIGELPRGIPANLVPFVAQVAAGIRKQLTVYGDDYPTPDGTSVRDYIHVVDLAKAHVKALSHVNRQSPRYYDACNIGTGTGTSVMQIIKMFEKVSRQSVRYKIGPRRAGDIASIYAGVKKSKKMLDWHAEKSLEDALTDAWRWQQKISK